MESVCRNDPREFSVQLPTQHRDVPYWVNAHICYSGLEQAMKMFIPTSRIRKLKPTNQHNLWELYQAVKETSILIGDEERKRPAGEAIKNIRLYYQAYHSFHRWQDRPKEKTSEEFLQNIGDKYTNWRYTLREEQDHPTMVHARFMLEIWRSLLKSGNSDWCMDRRRTGRIDSRVQYFFEEMFSDAQTNLYIIELERGETPGRRIDEWTESVGGELVAGLWLFRHIHSPDEHPFDDVEHDIRESVLRSANRYFNQVKTREFQSTNIYDFMPDRYERLNEIARMHFMCSDGLRWNSELEVFEIKDDYT